MSDYSRKVNSLRSDRSIVNSIYDVIMLPLPYCLTSCWQITGSREWRIDVIGCWMMRDTQPTLLPDYRVHPTAGPFLIFIHSFIRTTTSRFTVLPSICFTLLKLSIWNKTALLLVDDIEGDLFHTICDK